VLKVAVNASVQLQVLNEDGSVVPPAEVLWAAQGAGWIDQGGLLRGFKDGLAEVSAFSRGMAVKATVMVGKGNVKPTTPKKASPPPSLP
jgi:hypothetical protein